jgi:hypothetical protein
MEILMSTLSFARFVFDSRPIIAATGIFGAVSDP